MRIRTIKPEFWESESLGTVSRDARLLFIGLFTCCDDSGRTRASSRLLASRLFPYDEDSIRLLPGWLKELEQKKCIRLYEVDGQSYLDIPNWLKHQKIDKPSKSKLPEFESVREDSRGFENNSLGSGIRDQGSGNGSGSEEGDLTKAEPRQHLNPDPDERMVRIGEVFGRRLTTPWDAREVKAYKQSAAVAHPEDFELVLDYYRNRGSEYLRKDIKTLLNNWNGELDRARAWKQNPATAKPKQPQGDWI